MLLESDLAAANFSTPRYPASSLLFKHETEQPCLACNLDGLNDLKGLPQLQDAEKDLGATKSG
jgi:hypothetical protein